jgi:zinc transport system ATP-binding protein
MMQIAVNNLSFYYHDNLILDHISLVLEDGDYLAVIGPNGGGKTTFVKLLLGLREPTSGTIMIDNTSPKAARNTIGYLPQYINFNMDMPINVIDIVLQGRMKKNKLFFNKKDREIALQELDKMQISHLKDRKIKELSGGQRQRVLLARALAKEPKILILDEPTASIDLEGQKEIYTILKSLPQTKIVVSHDINILFEGVNKVAHINKKLHLHEGLSDAIKKNDGHFCEMELLDILKENHV